MLRLSAIILGTTIALVQPQIPWGKDVVDIVEKITVFIDGCSGSGVIYKKEGNTYYVLTADRVVEENPRFCRVITPDGEVHDPGYDNIEHLEDLDLAVVKFVSNKEYQFGKLGDSKSITIGKTVYIPGAPPKSQAIPVRTLGVSPGEIIGIAPESYEGYILIYNNTTRGGMSGGPILNADGEIIGIHGKGDLKDGSKENYGIPIEKFQEARGSRFWPIPTEGTDDGNESGDGGSEGLSLPLILLGGLAILGGGASLGYLFGFRTQSKNKNKEIGPSREVSSSRVVREREPKSKVGPNPVTPSQSEPPRPVKEQTIQHEEKLSSTSEITASQSKPVEQTILSVDHPEVTAQPEEPVTAKYQKLRDLLAAGEWKEADKETAILMLQVAGREEEGWLRYKYIENFPCEDLRAIDKLWVKYSNGRFGFSVQKRIWLEEGGKIDWETECRLGDRVGWRVKGEWQFYSDLTFCVAAPSGHLPGWWASEGVWVWGGGGLVLLSRTDV